MVTFVTFFHPEDFVCDSKAERENATDLLFSTSLNNKSYFHKATFLLSLSSSCLFSWWKLYLYMQIKIRLAGLHVISQWMKFIKESQTIPSFIIWVENVYADFCLCAYDLHRVFCICKISRKIWTLLSWRLKSSKSYVKVQTNVIKCNQDFCLFICFFLFYKSQTAQPITT